jgi:hypothetical protein
MDKSLKNSAQTIEFARQIFVFIISWVVLTAISIIISGKFAAKIIRIGLSGDDQFLINLIWLKLKSTKDEVVLGFAFFIVAFVIVFILGGEGAYDFFKKHSGLDIGQWNSLCVMSALLCASFCFILYLISLLFKKSPIITNEERKSIIEKLSNE